MRTLLLLSATLIALVGSAPTAAAQASRGQHLGDTATDSAQTRHATQTAAEDAQRAGQTCYTMRSYLFHRQDGQAPVLAGMTTCTPASVLQQRQVSPAPRVLYVPLSLESSDQQQPK